MADKWKDLGSVADLRQLFGLFGETHEVENKETGERRFVDVHRFQDVGDAIANGQFLDKKD